MGDLYNLILSNHYYIGIFLIFITLIGIYYISKKFYINFINKFVISIVIISIIEYLYFTKYFEVLVLINIFTFLMLYLITDKFVNLTDMR